MFPAQIPRTDPDDQSRCRDSSQLIAGEQKERSENTRSDAALAHEVDDALWKDGILRALDYNSIEIHVKSGIVNLYGHVVSLTNQHQAEEVLNGVGGILGIRNHLIPDDRLVVEVATALGSLERQYHCKFFTGVSHGVVLLSGNVDNVDIKLLAEKCAARNPNVRGVISGVSVRGSGPVLQDQRFLQPAIGAEISFLDGVSGRVRHVIINPDNRLVVAMTIHGQFADRRQELKSLNNNSDARPPERVLVLPVRTVRHLSRTSGFLNIRINQRDQYMEFDPAHFFVPDKGWKPPYPYCPDDVLLAVEPPDGANWVSQRIPLSAIAVGVNEDQLLREQMPANDSLGGQEQSTIIWAAPFSSQEYSFQSTYEKYVECRPSKALK